MVQHIPSRYLAAIHQPICHNASFFFFISFFLIRTSTLQPFLRKALNRKRAFQLILQAKEPLTLAVGLQLQPLDYSAIASCLLKINVSLLVPKLQFSPFLSFLNSFPNPTSFSISSQCFVISSLFARKICYANCLQPHFISYFLFVHSVHSIRLLHLPYRRWGLCWVTLRHTSTLRHYADFFLFKFKNHLFVFLYFQTGTFHLLH